MIEEGTVAILVPIIIFMIPIIAILTAHQRKMAEIIHGKNGQNMNPQGLNPSYASQQDMAMMREEMRQLRELVQNQTLAIDNLGTRQRNEDISGRIGQEGR